MRYEDASQTGSTGSEVNARDDSEHLAGNDFGPATGNLITGSGTVSGATGTDMAGAGAHITAIAGPGGADTEFDANGKLEVAGQYGTLTIDAEGNYTYVRNPGGPEGVSETFTYTLADAAGATDTANLVVNIGNLPMLQAQGTQTIQTANGVVVLPAGVQLSDVRVVGRDLVITLPDGSKMVIPDGAIFVPQLVVDGVEVPASNLAALLIDSEPKPAAGDTSPTALSSGGNFEVPVQPLDPGVPLGDLIPPTELFYTPPETREIFDRVDEDTFAGNVFVELDDDVIPGKGGNPGGTGDDPPNAPDDNVVSGVLPGSGGEGSLTWSLLGSGAPAGFTYSVQPDGSMQVVQVQGGSNVVVLTITVNSATGAFVATENNPVRHAPGDNENNANFVINYTVTDSNGSIATGSLNINVDDDTPTASVTAGPDANVILTTDDVDTKGVNSDTASTLADFSGVFTGTTTSPGADGAGAGTTGGYALAVTSSTSGLSSHGSAINLFVVSGTVVGTTAGSAPASLADPSIVFTVSVNGSGVVTLTQMQQIDHAAETPSGAPFNDQFASMADGLVTLTRSATVVDNDGDSVTASATVSIGANLHFTDDGPVVSGAQLGSSVLLDETDGAEPLSSGPPISATSAAAIIVGTGVDFGADGPGGSPVYGLSLNGGVNTLASGLQTAAGDFPITLNLVDSTHITGTYNGANVAFSITMNANGTITVTQNTALEHLVDGPPGPAHDDALHLTTLVGEVPVSLVNATVTYEDFDHDTATATAAIGNAITFKDDGPSVDITVGTEATVLLTTDDDGTEGSGTTSAQTAANFAGVFSLGSSSGGGDGTASVPVLQYQLATVGGDSGLNSHGVDINLYMVGTTVVGATGSQPADLSDPDIVFTVAVNDSGVVTLTQFQQIDHADEAPGATDAPFSDQSTHIALDSLITLTASATITDNDGDTASDSESINIAANLIFRDDGPTIDASLIQGASVHVDESLPGVDNPGETDAVGLGQATVAISAIVSVVESPISADQPTAIGYTLVLGAAGGNGLVDSGMLTSAGDLPVYLYLQGDGSVIGSTALSAGTVAPGNTVFTVALSGGNVVLTQFQAIEHGDAPSNYDENTLGLAANALQLQATGTDYDGDTDTDNVDLGSVITFGDDGPVASVDGQARPDTIVLDESRPVTTDTAGANPPAGLDTATANFADNFTGPTDYGSDGPGSVSYALHLSASSVGSGLFALQPSDTSLAGVDSDGFGQGAQIMMSQVGDVITGSVGITQYFTISIDPNTGIVTFTQLNPIWHPTPGSSYDEAAALSTAVAADLQVIQSVTDADGDVATAPLNIGQGVFSIQDDGPIAVNDGSRGTFNDSASNVNIGNVSLLLANDDFGSDGPAGANGNGAITIATGSLGGTITIDGSGNMLYTSNHDTLPGNTDVETFTYTVRDADGDTTSATFTVSLTESAPTIQPTSFSVDEEGLPNGIAGTVYLDGSDLAGTSTSASGTLTGFSFGGDGQGATGNIVLAASADTGLRTLSNHVVATVWDGATHTLTGFDDANGNGAKDGGEGTVFTLQIDNVATGHYVFNLLQPVKHTVTDSEDDKSFSVNVTVTDSDGDPASSTIGITIDDDSPDVVAVLNTNAAVELDETLPSSATTISLVGIAKGNDPDLSDATGLAIGRAVSAVSVLNLTTEAYGADGPAANPDDAVYSLTVNNATSGLTITEGQPITLVSQQNGTVVVGVVQGGTFAGQAAFAIQINAETGVITVEQYLSLDHPVEGSSAAAHNDPLSMTAGHISASVVIKDGDGDTDTSSAVDVSGLITFRDDGPDVVAALNTNAAVELDETLPSSATTIALVGVTKGNDPDLIDATGTAIGRAVSAQSVLSLTTNNPGADGPAADPNDAIYKLAINNASSGLTITEGNSITLVSQQNDTVIVGIVQGVGAFAGQAAFAIQIDPTTGIITVEQYLSLDHPVEGSSAAAHNDPLSMTAGHVSAIVTIQDGDNDTDASSPVDISGLITFRDDGPSVTASGAGEPTLQVDESNFGGNAGPTSFAGQFTYNFGADGQAATNPFQYNLGINAGSTGLVDTALNVAIVLSVEGGAVLGRAGVGGPIAFTISVDAAGQVSLDQARAIVHPNMSDPNDSKTFLADNLITLTATITDGDGDTATVGTPLAIAQDFVFLDDGPTITPPVTDPLEIANTGATPTGTGDLNFSVGADINSDFDDISVANFGITINGDPATNVVLTPNVDGSGNPAPETATTASYRFTFQYDTGTGGLANGVGTLVFNKSTGEYTVALTSGPIAGVTLADTGSAGVSDFVAHDAPGQVGGSPEIQNVHIADNLFIQFTSGSVPNNGTFQTTDFPSINPDPAPEVPPDPNLQWVTGDVFNDNNATFGTVTASSAAIGANSNTLQNEEVIEFNLYAADPGAVPNTDPTTHSGEMFVQFDLISDVDDLVVVLKLVDTITGDFTTKTIIVDAADLYRGNSAADEAFLATTIYSDFSAMGNNEALLVIQENDYNGAGEHWEIVGGQILVSPTDVTGNGINLNRGLGSTGGSSASQAFTTDTDVGSAKIMSIGFVVEDTTDQQATIEFDVTITDGDGDSVTQQDITVNIGGPSPTTLAATKTAGPSTMEALSSHSLLVADTHEVERVAANSNSVALAAAVAAAGVVSTAAAASGPDVQDAQPAIVRSVGPQVMGSFDSNVHSSFDAESFTPMRGGVDQGMHAMASTSHTAIAASHVGELAPALSMGSGPGALLDATDMSAMMQMPAAVTGMKVAMASVAEALVPAQAGVSAQDTGGVAQIIADALHGGGSAPSIDAILNALPGQGLGENAGLQGLATQLGHDVPIGDMGHGGGFTFDIAAIITTEAMVLHHDAVQPVANG